MTTTAPPVLRAHLLLQVDPGLVDAAAGDVAAVAGVREALRTSGSYDVIAVVEVASESELGRVLRRVRAARGLVRLRVCRG